MSTQAGVWNFEGRPLHAAFLERLNSAIEWYGPDGGNTYIGGSVGMVYRHFDTTPESHLERQPRVSVRGNVGMWEGRLDNRAELIAQLRDENLEDRTDLTIVMTAYEKWGTGCFKKFIGDWALSIWNAQNQDLILARDYAGVRHLYYSLSSVEVRWCTNLDALILIADAQFTLDEEYIAGYLTLYPEPHLTPFREIHSVPPGKFVSIHSRRTSVQTYWAFEPPKRIRYKTDGEYEEHFRHVFSQAVRRRLRSSGAVLAELSGGLDSSSIVCMAKHILATEGEFSCVGLNTFSVYDSKEAEGDERPYFTKVEEKIGIAGCHIDSSKHMYSFSPDFHQLIPTPACLAYNRELEAAQYQLMKGQGNRIVLSGIGGDELLGGVPDPRAQLADLILQFRLKTLSRQLMAWSLVKKRPWIHLLLGALTEFLPVSLRVLFERRARVDPWIAPQFARRLKLPARLLGPQGGFGFYLPSRRSYAQTFALLTHQMTYFQPPLFGCWEKRYAFLDQNLVEFLVAIPAEQLLRPGDRRSLMRRAFRDLLPQEILKRRTKGSIARIYMVAVQSQWDQLVNLLQSSLLSELGFSNPLRMQEALFAAKNGNARDLVRILKGLHLELWLRVLTGRNLLFRERDLRNPGTARLVASKT